MSVLDQKLQDLHIRLKQKQLSVTELVQSSLDRIAAVDDQLNAFITVDKEGALATASELDSLSEAKERGLLFGIPGGIKDNISTTGLRTTCASRILSNFTPLYNATVMDKLHAAQSVMIGKCNMDEFAMGSSTETSYFDIARNPWDMERVPGGSSGGSGI
jgi:aspartyl-tRNA(Asn)/glutamyl-tRNA(Gln) amidotransferase subunit A